RQDHSILDRLGEGAHELRKELEDDVGLLEFGVRLVVDERDAKFDLVIQDLRQPHVLALGVRHHFLKERFLFGVVIDVEVRRAIDAPVEPLIDDLVLAEGEDARGTQGRSRDESQEDRREKTSQAGSYSVKMTRCAGRGCGTTIPTTPSSNCSKSAYRAVRRSVPWP